MTFEFQTWEIQTLFFVDKIILNKKVINNNVTSLFDIYTLFFVVSPSEVIWKIQILNVRNSNLAFLEKIISNVKFINCKVL